MPAFHSQICPVEAMPKPVYATADELAEAVKKLEGQARSVGVEICRNVDVARPRQIHDS